MNQANVSEHKRVSARARSVAVRGAKSLHLPVANPPLLLVRGLHMRKLPAVEDARAIMTEGMEWGVWKWLMEKKRVRAIADEARAALDEFEMKVKATWSDELKIAYNQLVSQDGDAETSAPEGQGREKGRSAEDRFPSHGRRQAGEGSR